MDGYAGESATTEHVRYLPPVYSPQPLGEICAAAGRTAVGRPLAALSAAAKALAQRYPNFTPVLTDCGTSALTIALELAFTKAALQGRVHRVVALPAYACPDLATAAVAAGATIVLYDVAPDTLAPDWESLKTVVQEGASVVVVAHLYGRVVDLGPALSLASATGAVIIEDAAQHAGGSAGGVRGGSQGSLGVLSFGRGKGINAGGGGALLCRTADAWALPEHPHPTRGWPALLKATAAEALSRPQLYGIPARLPHLGIGETRYHAPRTVQPMVAAVAHMLVTALHLEPRLLAGRRYREAQYTERLTDRSPAVTLLRPVEESGALRTPVLLNPAFAASKPQLSRLGVVRSYPRTLAHYPEFVELVQNTSCAFPGATQLAREMFTLPTHDLVRDAEVQALCALLSSAERGPR